MTGSQTNGKGRCGTGGAFAATFLACAVLAGAFAAPGCNMPRLLGYEDQFVFIGRDAIVVPGQDVSLQVRLRKGWFLDDQDVVWVRFYRGRTLWHVAMTDDEGQAAMEFRPDSPGDYAFEAEAWPSGRPGLEPVRAHVTVACRRPDAPLCVLDIDKTLASPPARLIIEGDPKPLAGSVEVAGKLAKEFTIVYLTERPDYLRRLTSRWLDEHGYPDGPVLMPRFNDLMDRSTPARKLISPVLAVLMLLQPDAEGSRRTFKGKQLTELRSRFTGRIIGIGDKPADARAYAAAGADAFLILALDKPNDRKWLLAQLAELRSLPAQVQVVGGWADIDQAIHEHRLFPRDAAIEKVSKLADAAPPN